MELQSNRRRFLEAELGVLPVLRLCAAWWARAVCTACGADAVTVGSLVLLSRPAQLEIECWSTDGRALLLHEAVHVRQYHELGIATFLWRYLRDYVRGRSRGLRHHDAYRTIAAEAEAWAREAGYRSRANRG